MFLSFLYCVLICVPEEAQVGETLYIFDDLLKRNFVTCVIRPKINIIQNLRMELCIWKQFYYKMYCSPISLLNHISDPDNFLIMAHFVKQI